MVNPFEVRRPVAALAGGTAAILGGKLESLSRLIATDQSADRSAHSKELIVDFAAQRNARNPEWSELRAMNPQQQSICCESLVSLRKFSDKGKQRQVHRDYDRADGDAKEADQDWFDHRQQVCNC